MGKRVSIPLAGILANPNIGIVLRRATQGQEFLEQLAEVTLYKDDGGADTYVLAVELEEDDSMHLSMDLNSYSDDFPKKYAFLEALGCQFSVY